MLYYQVKCKSILIDLNQENEKFSVPMMAQVIWKLFVVTDSTTGIWHSCHLVIHTCSYLQGKEVLQSLVFVISLQSRQRTRLCGNLPVGSISCADALRELL
jgi:hypothetical protein